MKLHPILITVPALLCAAAAAIPAAARAPRHAAPHPPPIPSLRTTPLSGTGAPYLQKMVAALRNKKSVRLLVHLNQSFVPRKGSIIRSNTSVDVAWIVPSHLYFHLVRPGGQSVEVGTPSGLYQYIVGQKQVLKRPANQIPYFMYQAQMQVMVVLPPATGNWTYSGVHSALGHPCDLLVQKDASAVKNVWLDRTTHLPRQVSSSGAGPAGSGNILAQFPVFEVDRPIPDSQFRFTVPRGVKVVVPPSPPAPKAPKRGSVPHRR